MAAHGWRKSPAVAAWLFEEGHAFDFYQAVALLEQLSPGAAPIGEGANPREEAVRFSSSISLAFPETDVARVAPPGEEGEPARMEVNFMGLAGVLGPLPAPFAELVYQRAVRGDRAARDFLDIFNHRLISFAYRIRKLHRVGLGVSSPEEDDAARHLFALVGLGGEGLRGRLSVPERALLHHAGNLANQNRSMEGLVAMLRHHFGVPIEAVPLTGAFRRIEPEDRTAIGKSGQNRVLGRSAGLGARFWDQESTFDLRVGPLTFAQFRRFLPDEDALAPLCELVRFYGGDRFHFGVVLVLAEGETPELRMGKKFTARLGQTAWLGRGRGAKEEDREVRLSSRVIETALRARREPEEGGAGMTEPPRGFDSKEPKPPDTT